MKSYRVTEDTLEEDPTIYVEGRRWFDRTYGNTYHTTEVFVNGESIGITPFAYGYGEHYLQSAHELLIEKGVLPDEKTPHGGRPALWRECQRIGYDFTYSVTDGLKRELHK